MNRKSQVRRGFLICPVFAFRLAIVLSVTTGVRAQPTLSLVKSATASAAVDSIVVGSAAYLLDLRVNTGGHAVSGLQFHTETTPAGAVIYGATPLSVLSNPFQLSDVV